MSAGRPSRITEAHIKKTVKLLISGKSVLAASKIIGVGVTGLYANLKKRGIDRNELQFARIVELYHKGLKRDEIKEITGHSNYHLANAFEWGGIDTAKKRRFEEKSTIRNISSSRQHETLISETTANNLAMRAWV